MAARVRRLQAYAIPAEHAERVRPGVAVRVPHGRYDRVVDGICARVAEREWDQTLRPIVDVGEAPPLLDEHLIELGLWISEYYACSPGLALEAFAPRSARASKPRTEWVAQLRQAIPPELTPKRRALCEVLARGPLPRAAALREAAVGASVLKGLVAANVVELVEREIAESPHDSATTPATSPEDTHALTPGQARAIESIVDHTRRPDPFAVFLLFGVPGSGKTEVYVRAARTVIAAERQAIVVVPEIALATQVVERLARRFARVAVLHSQLSDRTRADTLRAIARGQVDVVIGTRTAVFAPCRHLGLIVVDEEQESSLKNLAAPYFHARDVAIKRGQLEGFPVVLGSATPALETWYNATHARHYHLLHLPERVPGARLPEARAVPMPPDSPMISPPLAVELRAVHAAGQQAILLHNRRGYATYLRCRRCGLSPRCPRCDAGLVLHQRAGERDKAELRCHRCGHRAALPTTCPDGSCGGTLARAGAAIQQLEQTLRRLLPGARLLRLDSDTMRRRDDYQAALASFEAGAADIMLGTQMVAKGLDFPDVRLVGVIDADAALALPDFRAGERVFQLLMQVVGRAGRKAGASRALVQAQDPNAPAVRSAIAMDYEGYARRELRSRERYFYPPFARLARLVVLDERPRVARTEAAALADRLRDLAGRVHPAIRVDPAGPCVIARLRDKVRHQMTIRAPRDGSMQKLLREAEDQKLLRTKAKRLTIDVDALDLL